MRIDIVTLFPEMFAGYFDASILGRAQTSKSLEISLVNLRDHAQGKHRITDEPPFGGGGGMVLKPGPLFGAVESLVGDSGGLGPQQGPADLGALNSRRPEWPIILLTPQGRLFDHDVTHELSQHQRLTLLCGRYEGVDERVRQHLATDEISIGDYVLTGGEVAAMVIVDAIARLLPGVLGAAGAAESDSHAGGLLEGPHYTRPAVFKGWSVPDVLRSGHQAHIQRWRRQQALRRTWQRRPELLLTAMLTAEDKSYLAELAKERAAELGQAID